MAGIHNRMSIDDHFYHGIACDNYRVCFKRNRVDSGGERMEKPEVEKIMNRFYDFLGHEEPNWVIDTSIRRALLEYEPEKAAGDKGENR